MEIDHAKENWSKHAVVYQLYPRSFKDSNGDGVGDLEGIIEKLDYLNDGTENSLGVNVIWLNPIYTSPQRDYGYDIADYTNIDPLFGDLKVFDRLVVEAKKRGIKIIMDFVPNHTSSDHPWFVESRSSKDNPKRDWYIWKDGKNNGNNPPNNWLSVFGGSAWSKDEVTGQYYMHSFLKDQPDLNWRNPEVKDEMLGVIKFWLHRGVAGFRTDAVYHLFKDKDFRDDPPNPNYVEGRDEPYNELIHTYSTGQPELIDTTNAICEVLGEHEDTFVMSEAYLGVKEMNELYGACANNLHAPFNFNLMSLPWDAMQFKRFIDEFDASLKSEDMPNYVFGNHDKSRLATRFGQPAARIAAMLLFTLRGMPFIYYGEELGKEDTHIPQDKVHDPFAKNVPGFDVGRDPERTPMQWDGGAYAGFSTVEPWLPIAEDYAQVNVEEQRKDEHSLFSLYRTLINFRENFQALIHGTYRSVDVGNDNVFAYFREGKEQKVFVVLNFSDAEQKISYDGVDTCNIAASTHLDREEGNPATLNEFRLRPYEGYVFTL